ncbi:MAG: hypothetical protein ACFFAO_21695 [Candidatus Hermodarchaeota archaeon]
MIYIYETQEKWDVVFELYKKTLEAFEKLRDVQGIITSYFNMGILKKKSNKLDEAIIYFKKGTNKAIDSNYTELILRGLSYIGESYFYLGNLKKAKNEYIKALYLAEKVKAKNAVIQLKILLNSLGLTEKNIELELKNYKEERKNKL